MILEQPRQRYTGVLLMLFCAACLCAGQLVWKCSDSLLALAAGFGIYGMGAAAMLCAYRFGKLSVLQPLTSVSYLFAVVLGWIFFDEAITMPKILGIAVMMAGVALLAGEGEQ